MNVTDMQKAVDQWIKTIGGGYFSELTNMVVLTEEVGELARIFARVYGDQVAKPGELTDPKAKLREEMADVLWVLCCLANQTGVDLQQAFEETIAKKTKRDSGRFSRIEKRGEINNYPKPPSLPKLSNPSQLS